MICIKSPSNDAHFNMALDEYMFESFKEDVFLLYINKNAVIVGRHQNTISEINSGYIKDNHIAVVRRITGGGAVYHDMGNLNFSFVTSDKGSKDVDFRRFTMPIISLLKKIGVNAEFQGRNDLTIDGRKFSGNAGLRKGDRVLSHGTLLFKADLKKAAAALNTDPEKYKHKKVKSVASRITNIWDHLPEKTTVEKFEELLVKHVISTYDDAEDYNLTQDDIDAVNELKKRKYDTWDWNYGKRAHYDMKRTLRTPGGTVTAELTVKDGIIADMAFSGDYFGARESEGLASMFTGVRHEESSILKILEEVDLREYMNGVPKADILTLLF